jgi:hypothetical protein
VCESATIIPRASREEQRLASRNQTPTLREFSEIVSNIKKKCEASALQSITYVTKNLEIIDLRADADLLPRALHVRNGLAIADREDPTCLPAQVGVMKHADASAMSIVPPESLIKHARELLEAVLRSHRDILWTDETLWNPMYRVEVSEYLQQAVRNWRSAATGKRTVEQLRHDIEAMPVWQRVKHKAALNLVAQTHDWLMQRVVIPSDKEIIEVNIELLGQAMQELATKCPFRWHA